MNYTIIVVERVDGTFEPFTYDDAGMAHEQYTYWMREVRRGRANHVTMYAAVKRD